MSVAIFSPESVYCVKKKVVVVNKFFTTEAKISALSELATESEWDLEALESAHRNLLTEICQTRLKL